MCSNHVNLISISLVSCLVLAALQGAQSESKTKATPVRTGELSRYPFLSSPEECSRKCRENEPPKTCYYHWTLELYNVLGRACERCTPNNTNPFENNCQCVTADGIERSLLTVNRQLPGPPIEVCKGDKVIVDVANHMPGMETTIHWHGIWQKGYQYADGVPFVTQCPIPEGTTFRYEWVANNGGTHFWHSHHGLQKIDGLYGSLIVREPPSKDPNSKLYDEDLSEHVILLSDWMHEQSTERFPGRLRSKTGQTPQSVLINGKGQYRNRTDGSMTKTPLAVFTVKSGRRYRFRLVNAGCTVCPAQVSIEGHALTVIGTDGEPVQPMNVTTIVSFAGERYDFIVTAKECRGAFWIQYRALGECGENEVQQLAILRYEGGPDKPKSRPPSYFKGLPQGRVLNPLDAICNKPRDDAICISQLKHARPVDEKILQDPDVKLVLPFFFHEYEPEELFQPNTYKHFLTGLSGGLVSSLINNISYEASSSPPLSQLHDIPPEQFCNGDNMPKDCEGVCTCTHKIEIPLNAVVEITLVDLGATPELAHPFHLHGQAFNLIAMGRSPYKNVTKMTPQLVRDLDKQGLLERNWDMLPFKDTISVPNNGYVVLRFRADNPGLWMFHCHFLFHIPIGMEVLLHVGTIEDLPPVPPHFPTCGDYKNPITPVEIRNS